jgi:hypothetical protein
MSQQNVELVYLAADAFNRRDLGDVTLATGLLRGHGSDTPPEKTIWHVARWRRRKCVWWRTFSTRDEAIEAVGLSEWPIVRTTACR